MKVDYIVVGLGLAGIGICEQLRAHNKTFVVFDDGSQRSSWVAGGLYNPVVLKRFTPVWKSKVQLNIALKHYKSIEQRLHINVIRPISVYRKFDSIEEQNNWFTASDKPELTDYLNTTLIKNDNAAVNAPFGFGKVNQTGRIDVINLIKAYTEELKGAGTYIKDAFNHSILNSSDTMLTYKNIAARGVIFAEGYGMHKNPYFKDLPLLPTKGELLTIHAPDLKIDYVLKGPVFLIPLQQDTYLVGATYGRGDTSHDITDIARSELVEKLKTLINCSFEVINHVAGIRPTVKDRRPLVGRHSDHKQLYVLNGLGTRGVMIGPYVAGQLFEFMEHNTPLDKEIDIRRFDK